MSNKKLIIIAAVFSISHSAYGQEIDKKQLAIANDIIWAADKVEVPRELLLALCWGESNFRTNVTHMDGGSLSHGICQVKLSTAQFMDQVYKHRVKATAQRLENTAINSFYAAKYLKYQLNRYEGNWQLAVDAYNKHNAVGENTKYVKKFKKAQALMNERYGQLVMAE